MGNWKNGTTGERKLLVIMKGWKKRGVSDWQVESWIKAVEKQRKRNSCFEVTNEEYEQRVQNWLDTYSRINVERDY